MTHADQALRASVGRTVAARDRLQAVTAELEAVTAGSMSRSDLEVAARRIVDMQERLRELRDRYDRLEADHQRLRHRHAVLSGEAAKAADRLTALGRDRSRLQVILGQWDVLATRLARSVGDRALPEPDRTIVATWSKWKRAATDRSVAGQAGRS